MMRLMILAATGMAVSTLAACTPGQSEFSCQGYPDGVSCISARNVYELTNSRSRVTQADIESTEAASGPAVGDVLRPLPTSDPRLGLAPPVGADQQAAEPADGVMRVWVGPHATSAGDVTAPNYIYSRVASTSNDRGGDITRRFEPLKGQAEPTRSSEARPLEAGDVVVTAKPYPAQDGQGASPSRPIAAWATNNVRVAEIYFDTGQAAVSNSGEGRLQNAASRLAELKPRAVLVAGFTDRVGSKEVNQRLAKQRVDAVVKILKDLGVRTEIIDAAQGEPEELKSGPDGAADPNNRKVWVVALDVMQKPTSATAPAPSDNPTPEATKKVEVEVQPGKPRRSLRRDPDDHGDNDDRGRKDHEPSMKH